MTRKQFDDVLRAAARSRTLGEALASDPQFPPPTTFFRFLRNHPAKKAKLDAALKTGKLFNDPSARHFQAIERLIAQGITITAALATSPQFPNLVQFLVFLKRYPAYRAKLDAAKPVGAITYGENPSRFYFDEIVGLIAKGMSVRAALYSKPEFPSPADFNNFVYGPRGATHRQRLAEAMKLGKRIWRGGFKFTDEDYNRALAAIISNPDKSLNAILGGDLPTYDALHERCTLDQSFRVRYVAATSGRNANRKISAKAPVGIWDHALYQRVSDAMSRVKLFVDPEVRLDLISDVVVDVWAGKVPPDEITSALSTHITRWNRENRPTRSLDEEMFEDGSTTLLDTLTADEWTFESA